MAFLHLPHPHLTTEQIARLSRIFDNAGQVALGGLVFAPFLTGSGFDNSRTLMLVSGVATVLLCWMTSLWLAKKQKEFYAI
jgi:hypothetical protein